MNTTRLYSQLMTNSVAMSFSFYSVFATCLSLSLSFCISRHGGVYFILAAVTLCKHPYIFHLFA